MTTWTEEDHAELCRAVRVLVEAAVKRIPADPEIVQRAQDLNARFDQYLREQLGYHPEEPCAEPHA